MRRETRQKIIAAAILLIFLAGCTRSASPTIIWKPFYTPTPNGMVAIPTAGVPADTQVTARPAGSVIESPTPDPAREIPTPRSETLTYTVQYGDSLNIIARKFSVDVGSILAANELANPNLLEVGQVLTIPPAQVRDPGPDFKIIPDSELVNGPALANFDSDAFITSMGGYLSRYYETVDNREMSGREIVERVGRENSVGARLLLAVIEYQSGWVTQENPRAETLEYPLGYANAWYKGLYRQLSWAANNLDRGYYLWRAGAVSVWVLGDGTAVPVAPTINAGTAAVQQLMAYLYDNGAWQQSVSAQGVFAIFQYLFGYPFDYAVEPLVPADLWQPEMQLPFARGESWSFTGGPHGGWADGSGWAALDFAPPGDPRGCVLSPNYAAAAADGVIAYSGYGMVILDLDGDGLEQTGWTVFYLHIDSEGRAPKGKQVQAGDIVGYPSCEGGFSMGTHIHIARKYNGEWIPADGKLPFIMDGWVSSGTGVEYDGYLTQDGNVVEAWDAYLPANQISR